MTFVEVLVAIAILVGIAGTVVPVIPGSITVAVAIGVWAIATGEPVGWAVFVAAAAILGLGMVLQYLLPGRRLRAAGVPGSTLWAGVGLAVVGFFVIPVVGLFVGFVVGVYAAETRRLGGTRARESTLHALKAVGLSMLIELTGCLLAASVWVAGVLAT